MLMPAVPLSRQTAEGAVGGPPTAAPRDMLAVGPEQVKRKREDGSQGILAMSPEADAASDVAVVATVFEAGVTPRRSSDGPDSLAGDGPRPMFSSNSPELVDRYKDAETMPEARFVVPDTRQQAGAVAGSDSAIVAAVGRQLSMSGLPTSGGAPFSVLPRSEAAEEPHGQAWLERPPTDRTEVQPSAVAMPVEHASPQWLAALEGQAAPKSLSVPYRASATQEVVATPLLPRRCGDHTGSAEVCQGLDLALAGCGGDVGGGVVPAPDDSEGRDISNAMPDEADAEAAGRKSSGKFAAGGDQSHRCEAWLTAQLAHAQRQSAEAPSRAEAAPSERGGVRDFATALKMLPARCSTGGVAQDQAVAGNAFDSLSNSGCKANDVRQAYQEAVAARPFRMHESPKADHWNGQDVSPVGSSTPEPFAWRGQLPGATARAAALEIRHFCAASQHSGDALPERDEAATRRCGGGPHRKAPARRKKAQSRLIVPHSPELATARRVHGEIRTQEPLSASKEHARRVIDVGRKRATVLAGHFRGSYAQRAAAAGRLRKAGAEVGYATLAKHKKKAARQEILSGYH